ncbi:MAG: hypothetical protein LBC37_05805 [Zoogloeaceae bacterium]|nr:hypothetical protein [Zoogloeaceae bacterium]
MREDAAENPNLPHALLATLANDPDAAVRKATRKLL